jgi:tRNA-dihydrouridine synthase
VSFLLKQEIQALVIHGRTGRQMYRGLADWEQIGKAVDIKNKVNPKMVLIGNGDVKDYNDVILKYNKYKVDGIMIGRAIFSDPWIFSKDGKQKERSSEEKLNLLKMHTDLYLNTWGDRKNFHNLKKFVKMYVNNYRGADSLRSRLMVCKTYAEFKNVLELVKPDEE